jgi:[protein-PII] uridylyltransferase
LKELKAQIEELISKKAPNFEIAKLIRENIKEYYTTLPQTFAQSGGKDFLLKHTRKIDSIVKLIYTVATREMFGEFFPTKNAIPLVITAMGSYGREQLSPKSDIDIMFVYKEIPAYNTIELIEKMYYLLLDSGLKLGHRVHKISELEEVANSDITIKTALLESRFLDGSKYLWFEVENSLQHIRHHNQKEFIEAKIEERRELRAKFPLMMEPNLKEGVGGFRDANLVYWIGKLLYNVPRIKDLPPEIVNEQDYKEFRVALEFLYRVRSALHLSVKRKTDQLRLEYIPDVAKLLGYKNTSKAHMIFAKKVNKSLRAIWLYSRIWIDALSSNTAPIYTNYLKPPHKFKNYKELLKFLIQSANEPFNSHPTLNLALLHTLQKSDSKERYKLIKQIFKAKYTSSILIALSEAGKLGSYITPLKKVEALPQFDGYHKYPVDTHLIKCVEALENITNSQLLELYNSLPKSKQLLLKLVTFMHDIGKGRQSDHHKIGAYLFKIYAQKLELPDEDIKIGYNLILHHNKLSQIAQKEDIYSSKVVAKFTAIFPSKIELDLIYLLTYADTTGVGSDIYNEFTARLFNTLYLHSIEFLQHKDFLNDMGKRVKAVAKIERSKEFKALPKTLQRKVLSIESNLPFSKYSIARIIEIAKRAIDVEDFIYEVTNNKFLTIEIIRKTPLNLGYLLAKVSNLNIVNIDIIKLFEDKKYFKIDFNQKVTDDDLEDIKFIIKDSFLEQQELALSKPKILKNEVIIDCNHSKDYALIKINTSDQKGLLAYIMTLFEELKIDIVSSKTYTHKRKVNDIFLVEKNGNFCKNLEYIKEKLIS